MWESSAALRVPWFLMCAPQYYAIEYEINPWMNRERRADHSLAVRQWNDLKSLLESLGAVVDLVTPQHGLPDLVFTANAAIIFRKRAFLSRFRHVQRQGEEPHFSRRLNELGFQVETPGEEMFLEGAGDALFCGETLFAGYRLRSTATSLQGVAAQMGCEVLPLELVDVRFYHLDTCFCPLSMDEAIWFPGAFDRYGQDVIRGRISRLIELSETEAAEFAANAVVVGHHVVTGTGCPQLHSDLMEAGYEPRETCLSEFLKAGGSAKCLTLRLDGEDAAAWATATRRGPSGDL